MTVQRRVSPWIVAAVAIASERVLGLRPTAIGGGVILMLALITALLDRSRRHGRSTPAPSRVGSAIVWVAAIVWALAGVATLASPAAAPWPTVLDLLLLFALITSVRAVGALCAALPLPDEGARDGLTVARAVVEQYGEDSLSPFLPRPDKSFEFAGGGVLAYRVIGETAVVSGDPVGPAGSEAQVLGQLLQRAHRSGLHVVLYGSSARHLATYRELGLRTLCTGEEAVVDPAGFTLDGRAVRKLRQSVHRTERRGWRIAALHGREIDADLEAQIDGLEDAWRSGRDRILGFAMGMGEFEPGVQPADLYLLAWSPTGELRAVMRFLAHQGKLSLDTMRRVGETPNGLNEALVCRALELAREGGVAEVSLNYAGLGQLVRGRHSGGPARRFLTRILVDRLGHRFQMERLVCFNEKFSPQWRPRYLVYESRAGLPRSAVRVLQAEGYLPEPRQLLAGRASELSRWLERVAPFAARIDGRMGR